MDNKQNQRIPINKPNQTLLAAIVVLVITVLGVGGYFLFATGQEKSTTNTNANTNLTLAVNENMNQAVNTNTEMNSNTTSNTNEVMNANTESSDLVNTAITNQIKDDDTSEEMPEQADILWMIYENEIYNYKVSYPNTLLLTSDSDGIVVFTPTDPQLSPVTFAYVQDASLEASLINTSYPIIDTISITQGLELDSTTYFVSLIPMPFTPDNFIKISWPESQTTEQYKQMVASFRFNDSSNSLVHTNELYKFQLTFPDSWAGYIVSDVSGAFGGVRFQHQTYEDVYVDISIIDLDNWGLFEGFTLIEKVGDIKYSYLKSSQPTDPDELMEWTKLNEIISTFKSI